MASNITQITDAINNLNVTFNETNVDGLFTQAILSTNESTGGWIGVLIFIMMSASVIIFLLKHKQQFNLFTDMQLYMVMCAVCLDFSIFLIVYGILESYQLFITLLLTFFILAFMSLLEKETFSPEV